MRIEAKLGFWLGGLALLVLILWLLSDVLMPFAAALAIAYLLDPVADRLEKVGLSRLGATLIILIAFVLGIFLLIAILAPALGHQIGDFIQELPGIAARLRDLITQQGSGFITRYIAPLAERFGIPLDGTQDALQGSVSDFTGEASKYAVGVLKGIWSGGRAVIGIVSLLVVTPVVAFYLLLDWDRIIAKVDSWVPIDQRETVR
ncbi:MAG: hypothetical protein JWO64_3592, partial [Hyphomicrobiales bacterium]|nr:hypothetical protein [Hyphomicrobiales bacterium]